MPQRSDFCIQTRGSQVADDIDRHIRRILSDRIYWLVNEADFKASDEERRRDHIFASLLALREFVARDRVR